MRMVALVRSYVQEVWLQKVDKEGMNTCILIQLRKRFYV